MRLLCLAAWLVSAPALQHTACGRPRASPAALARPRSPGPALAVSRSEAPIFDGKPYTVELVPSSARRAALVTAGSGLLLALTLPNAPEFWSADAFEPSFRPLLTMASMLALTVAGWRAFGVDTHPITAKARGEQPPPSYAFQVLGLGGAILGAAALGLNWYPLPVAGSGLEAAHCALPFVMWQVDTLLIRWLNPQVEWTEDATSLPANYAAEYADPLAAFLAFFGVLMFEVYVQQALAAQLTLGGWPLLASAGLIAANAGLINHALANGLLNGVLCAEFYWTVSLMFAVSNSVLPVGIYHHLMYSMPLFVKRYDEAVQGAPSPAAHATLLHGTLAIWHLAAFSALELLVPQALPPLPPLADGLGLFPRSAGAGVGLAALALFGAAAASVAASALGDGEVPPAAEPEP